MELAGSALSAGMASVRIWIGGLRCLIYGYTLSTGQLEGYLWYPVPPDRPHPGRPHPHRIPSLKFRPMGDRQV